MSLELFLRKSVTRMMHKFSTATTKSSDLPVRPAKAGAPNVPVGVSRWLTRTAQAARFLPVWLRFCHPNCSGEPLVASHRLAPTSLRDKNLWIIRARRVLTFSTLALSLITSGVAQDKEKIKQLAPSAQACRELGIGFVPYSPLGRGFLTGRIAILDDLEEKDRRRDHPRFHEDNLAQNQALLAPIRALALEKGREPAEIALAWVLAKGSDIVPIPGAKRRDHLEQNAGAVDLELSAEDVTRLDDAIPPGTTAGTRYPAGGMKRVNI